MRTPPSVRQQGHERQVGRGRNPSPPTESYSRHSPPHMCLIGSTRLSHTRLEGLLCGRKREVAVCSCRCGSCEGGRGTWPLTSPTSDSKGFSLWLCGDLPTLLGWSCLGFRAATHKLLSCFVDWVPICYSDNSLLGRRGWRLSAVCRF